MVLRLDAEEDDCWRELCELGRLLWPVDRLRLEGAGRVSTLFTGIDCDRRGARPPPGPCRDLPPCLLLDFFVDPNNDEKTLPPLDDFLLPELWRCGEVAFFSRCRLADLISLIPFHLIDSSPINVPLIFTNQPCTVDDFSLP